MKPLILLLSLLATQTLAHQQSRFTVHPPVVPHLFPSEIIARTEHAAYQLWRIHHPALLDEQERRLLDAAGVRDMTGYISHMADLLDLDIWHASPSHVDVLVPTEAVRERLMSSLPPRYGAQVEVIIPDFPALYDSAEVVPLPSGDAGAVEDPDVDSEQQQQQQDEEDEVDAWGKPKHRKGGRRHRKRPSRPDPRPPTAPTPPRAPPPPPPPGSNRTSPDRYNTTDLQTRFHDAYHPLSVIYDFMDELSVTFTGTVRVVTLGLSAEGREIKGVKIHRARSKQEAEAGNVVGASEETAGRRVRGKGRKRRSPAAAAEEEQRQEIYIQGGQHAREWVSPASILYFTHHLLVSAFIENNTHALDLVDRYEFTLVPTINPDGYVYSQEHSRLWRKNRQDLDYGNCRGIDMNSNWGYQWSPAGALFSNPCSESYPGARAFEAVETQVVAEYLKHTPNDVRAFVDVHSYGQLFMFPYSYSCSDFPKDAETLMEAALGVAKSVKGIHGTSYQAGQACDLIYRMAGDAIDWSYASAGIEWSYSAELRDTGTYGFLLPASLIRPSAEEITAGLVYLAQFIARLESPS